MQFDSEARTDYACRMPEAKSRQMTTSADISVQHSPSGASSLQRLGAKTFFRPRDAAALGVHSRALRRLVNDGSVERVARGLYRLTHVEPTEHYTLAAVCARVPDSIVCLLSALTVHGLGTQLPWQEWIAIPHKARTPRLPELPVRIVPLLGGIAALRRRTSKFRGRSRPHHEPGPDRRRLFPLSQARRQGRRARGAARRPARPQGKR